jgi:ribosome-associated protein
MVPSARITERSFDAEFTFSAVRSSGAGGQNVNKVSSKVELRFDIKNSSLLTEDEKTEFIKKAGKRVSKEGVLQIVSQESRSQLANKNNAIKIFYHLLSFYFKKNKKRIPTKTTFAAKQGRLHHKKIQGQKKQSRNFKDSGDNA